MNTSLLSSALVVLSLSALLGTGCASSPFEDREPEAASQAGLVARYEVVVTKSSYSGWGPVSHACTRSYPLTVYTPNGAPPAPVFLYMPGTGASTYARAEGDAAARAFAARGFLSVVVQYASLAGFACDAMIEKARCAFSETMSNSALSRACALPGADCSRGVVVGGLSQGAALGVLSRNYSTKIRAAWLMGFGGGKPGDAWTGCYVSGRTSFADTQLRVINGESDNQNQTNLDAALGTACPPGSLDCLRADGSGYFRPRDSDVEDGNADHCFFVAPNASGKEVGCTNFPPAMDRGWDAPARAPWSLVPNLEWLASRCD